MVCITRTVSRDFSVSGRNAVLSFFCILAFALNVATIAEAGEDTSSGVGYCTVNGGTTGGAGGKTVTVDNFKDLQFYLNSDKPYIVQVEGTINTPEDEAGVPLNNVDVELNSNKTIVGLGSDATIIGCLRANPKKNIIIRNLTISNPDGLGSESDGMILDEYSQNIWVDHCTFFDTPDELLSIKDGCDWITVSWCKFYYTNDPRIRSWKAILIGKSDNNAAVDRGKLHVTLHHNWFAERVDQRMPRGRFFRVHGFDNYYSSSGNS